MSYDLAGSSQSRESVMSSNQGRSLINPLVQSKMEGAVGTAVPPALRKTDSLPHYSHDKALPIGRGYFSYSLSGQDPLDFNALWDSSKTCVRNGSSPGIHPSATEGSITIPGIYRPENVSFPVDGGGRSAEPQRLAYYACSPQHHSPRHHSPRHHSPRHHSPAAGVISPVAVPNSRIVSSTDAEGCVGLAVPKPVYGHSPCCTERGCAHNYGVEHGAHRMSPRIYDDEWAAHFSRLAYLHKKGQEALAQQRALQLERGAEGIPLEDGKTDGYHGIRTNGPGRSLPLMEPSHSGYTYNTAHPYIATSEYCQRAPIPLQIHRGLPAAYDPRTLTHRGVPPKVYPDRPYVPKYTQIPPCSSVYYEAYRADPNAVTAELAQHNHMPQFHSPQPDLSNLSTSCSVVPPHHPLITKFPTYHPYRVRLNTNQAPLHERPLSIHQSERPLDFSLRRVQTPDSPQELCRQSGTPGAFHPTLANYRRPNSAAAERPFDYSEVAGTGFLANGCKELATIPKSYENEHRHCGSPNKDSLPKRHRDESDNGTEIDVPVKKLKIVATEQADESPSCPPMPVINKVFSLAPYKMYFEATGMLSPQENSESPQPEPARLKKEPDIQSRDQKANSCENDLGPKQEAMPATSNGQAETEETIKIKKEKLDPDETAYQSEMKVCVIEEMNNTVSVKEEQGELEESISGSVPDNIVIKNDLNSDPPLEEKSESCKTENAVKESEVPTLPPPLTKYSLYKIPPHCLKLSNFKIVIPEILRTPTTQPVDVPQSPVEVKPIISSSKQARHQFMELHQSLCRLIHSFVTHTRCQELKDWLCKLDLKESSSHPSKPQKVSCLLGLKIREEWLKSEETVMALQKVVCQLQKYIESRECPFPHVMRAGAVFIPMLVVKEVLFPQVQGTFIDQVLQEHRVELRPTTLSEERQLTQLHKKAFSSKLRRLLSLKHLPDIYPDVLNLLYHVNVCKFLDSTATDGVQKLPRSKNQLDIHEREYGQLR
ncbi:uncharacterized protein C15orf39 homolog isoform X1 [Triplophysa rosa]|nr:uncharacterized protein C15orf39 homolog isoform X1 [Triplophysa rosa]